MPDGKSALLQDGVHSLPDGKVTRPIRLEGTVAAVDPSGGYALTLFKEVVVLWDLRSGQRVRDFAGSLNPQIQASFSPDGKFFVSAGDRFARIWEVGTGNCTQKLKKHETQTVKARYSPDGKSVVSIAEGDYQLKLWDSSNGSEKLIITMPGHEGNPEWMDMPHDVAWSRDGKTLIGGSCTLCVYDAATGQFLIEVDSGGGNISAITTHPDGRTCIATVFYMEGEAVSGVFLRTMDLQTGETGGEVQVEAAGNLHLTKDSKLVLAEAVDSVEVYSIT
jgi:WD40 repeat protein